MIDAVTPRQAALLACAAKLAARGSTPSNRRLAAELDLSFMTISKDRRVLIDLGLWPHEVPKGGYAANFAGPEDDDEPAEGSIDIYRLAEEIRAGWDEIRYSRAAGGVGPVRVVRVSVEGD